MASTDVWVQCENPSCQKWRLLPPGTVVDETKPWFCSMNPDPLHNSCDAPEVEYNDTSAEETPTPVSATPPPAAPAPAAPAVASLPPPPPPAIAPVAVEASRRLLANLGVWDELDPVAAVPPETWREMARADQGLAAAAVAAVDAASAAAVRRAAGRDALTAPGIDADALSRVALMLLAKRVLAVAQQTA